MSKPQYHGAPNWNTWYIGQMLYDDEVATSSIGRIVDNYDGGEAVKEYVFNLLGEFTQYGKNDITTELFDHALEETDYRHIAASLRTNYLDSYGGDIELCEDCGHHVNDCICEDRNDE